MAINSFNRAVKRAAGALDHLSERARQIEALALRRLRDRDVGRRLRGYLEYR